jgi:predicted metal-binding protein
MAGVREQIEKLVSGAAPERRPWEWAFVPVSSLVFSPELFATCATNVCGNYGTTWTCPPACGTLEEQKQKLGAFKDAFVFTTKYDLEDSFDYEAMTAGREAHTALTLDIRSKLPPGLSVYGAGACPYCEKCAYPEPCRFPDKAIQSVEAAGIDVTALSRAAGVKYNNGPNTVTYFSMILF